MADSAPRGSIRFGAFELDPTSGELLKRGVRLRLRDKPLQVLLALLERPGETVTRKELQDRLWHGDTFVEFENGLNNAVSRLREALGDSADSPRYIETLPRRGYRFVAPIESTAPPVAEIPPQPSPPDESHRVAAAVGGATQRRRWLIAAGVAVVAVALAGLAMNWRRPAAPATNSVAVLPFVAASADEESADHYVAFGLTDALISELSRVGVLKVISQTSALRYRGERKALPVIARELGVGTVVEGSVVHESGQLRLTVQLIDARTDTHLWAQTYTRDPAEALTGQRALAREIAGIIRTRLVPDDRTASPAVRQTNPAAYEAYLKGRYFLQRPGEPHMAKARAFFEQAIAADPGFAPAHVGLSNYFLYTDAVAPAEAMARARASAERALALDESSARAHASLAFVHYFGDWDWAAAERRFTRALELDPNDATSRRWHALYLSSMGRHATATEEAARAIELDPVSISSFDSAAAVAGNARRFDAVLEYARRMSELDADDPRVFMHFASGYLHLGRFAEAVAWAEKGALASARDPAFLCVLSVAQHRAGQTAEARKTLAEIDQIAKKGYVPDVFLAVAYAWLRGHDAAIERLQEALERRDGYLVVVKVAPWSDPLRPDPRFQELLRRMNFPE
jgi:TolB-like protein/DNA-binding winged helix-turn-helix (wHTH) protein/tetratricopeptide (TPR) repeat protein